MHARLTAVALGAATTGALAGALLGLTGPVPARHPQLDDCVQSLDESQGISPDDAERICKGASRADLD